MEPEYEITNDATRFDVELIHRFLASSYWAPGVPRAVVEKSIRNSLGFAAMQGTKQVGFARVTTDYATIAIIGDVFVVPGHRGRGVSKLLMAAIVSHPELQGLRRLLLATRDAHGLYAQFGFKPLEQPDMFMSIHHPDIYRSGAGTAD